MNAAQVLDHFDRISEAPEAIPRLRRFILDLAVRGKLVETRPHEGSGSMLLDTVRTLKEELMIERRLRNQNEEDYSELIPACHIPATWIWAYVNDVALVQGGKRLPAGATFSPKPTPHIYIRVTDMKDATIIADELRYITGDVQRSIAKYTINKEDLYVTIAGTIGQVGKVPPIFNGQNLTENAAKIVFRGVDPDFFCMALNSDLVQQQFRQKTNQVAQPKLALKRILGTRFPLPPLGEQHRIVAKVDELIALCDQLEAAQTERENRRDRLAASSLHRLNNGVDTDDLRENARFHLRHIPRLTTRPEHIQQLRQCILNLAVRGKLVPQDPNDEPASELLKRIQVNKARLVKEGEAKQQKRQAPRMNAAERFSIPESWRWVSLGDIALGFRYGTSVKCSYEPRGEPVLRIPNVANGRIDIEDLKYGSLSEREANDLRLRLGDILMVRSNGSLNLVGRPALVEAQAVGFCYAGYLVRLRTSTIHLDPRYLLLVLTTTHIRDQIEIPIRTTVGLKNVNATELSHLTIPLPPLGEQHRIVAKVDELMGLCAGLDAQLTSTQTESRRLLEAVLHEALTLHTGNDRSAHL